MTLVFVVALALAAVVLSAPLVRVCDRAAGWPLAGLFIAAAVILCRHLPAITDGQPLTSRWTWVPDFVAPGVDVAFSLRADALGAFFALLALLVGAVVFIYSAAYLPKHEGNTSFYLIMTAFTLAVLLLVLADDAVVLFAGWELVSIASFLLIARSGSSGEAGSMRTLVLTFIGGLTLLAALAIAVAATGTTNLTQMLHSGVWAERPTLTACVAVLIALSAFTKSAQLPFHFWLPEAMAAATPVSAFLHAAAVVKAGVYLLLRFSTVFRDVWVWNVLLIVIGIVTAVVSALFAIQKTDLKKLTAYSTVSHLGWIVATIGIGTPFALAAAVVHTAAHALFKSSLFMLIGVIDHENGTRDIRRLGKIWNKMPWTFGSVVIGALSMAAVPPLFGFISKEGMLTAFEEAPFSTGATWALLIFASLGALFTFTYSAKFVFGAFIDGSDNPARNDPDVHEAPLALWLPAALPGVLSLPLGFVAGLFDAPVDHVVATITGGTPAHTHLALWHGISTPLVISAVVIVLGIAGLWARDGLWHTLESRELLPRSGNDLLSATQRGATALGRWLGKLADSLNPSRHVIWPFLLVIVVGIATAFFGGPGIDGVHLAPRAEGLDNPLDLGPLLIIAVSVIGLVRTSNRITAAVLVGTTGVGVTLQMLLLGAPDVALTQFLVESLTVVILMLVLRYQPKAFQPVGQGHKWRAAVIAVAAGVTTFAGIFTLLGRHGRSNLAEWYIANGPDITGGENIVATIIVEFRALDTLGELSVLGMAAIVIGTIVASFPREPFPQGTRPRPFGQSQLNSIPLKKGFALVAPIMGVLSVLAFMRGHADPGGGFVAALIAGTGIMMAYLAKGRDAIIFRPATPYILTGVGIITALSAGFVGLTQGSFLTPIYGHIFGQHLTTSAIFDGGIYMAVLGMLTSAVNSLGGYLKPGVTNPEELSYYRSEDGPLPATPRVYVSDPDRVDIPYPEPLNPNPREEDFGPNRERANASAATGLLFAEREAASATDTEFPDAAEHYAEDEGTSESDEKSEAKDR